VILARRAQFLAAALAGIGCTAPRAGSAPVVVASPQASDVVDDDRDRDGLANLYDKCPDAAEDRDHFEDDDGCPDPDNDKDGVLDNDDKCPDVPAQPPSTDGCPKPTVCLSIVDGPLQIHERVYFHEGEAKIRPESFAVLDAIVAVLAAHPEIRVEVQGHCDSVEKSSAAPARAKAVVAYLVAHGVDAKRLASKSLGATVPAASNTTAEGRERNRRVEFVRTDQ
jgi:outer membrane protein OmpA-like peptidoglycan-associated protein